MEAPVKVLSAVVVAAALGFGGFVVSEHVDRQGLVKAAERACGPLDTPVGAPMAPAGFVLPAGQKLLSVTTQGATTLVVASTSGQRADIVQVRDAVLGSLVRTGDTKKSADQEAGYEAEAELAGKGAGTLKVRPLCTDRVEVRYTLRG